MSDFAARLRQLREKSELTQSELAVKAGLHRHSIAQFEQGLREPSWNSVRAIAKALGVSCQEFEKPATAKSKKRKPGRPAK